MEMNVDIGFRNPGTSSARSRSPVFDFDQEWANHVHSVRKAHPAPPTATTVASSAGPRILEFEPATGYYSMMGSQAVFAMDGMETMATGPCATSREGWNPITIPPPPLISTTTKQQQQPHSLADEVLAYLTSNEDVAMRCYDDYFMDSTMIPQDTSPTFSASFTSGSTSTVPALSTSPSSYSPRSSWGSKRTSTDDIPIYPSSSTGAPTSSSVQPKRRRLNGTPTHRMFYIDDSAPVSGEDHEEGPIWEVLQGAWDDDRRSGPQVAPILRVREMPKLQEPIPQRPVVIGDRPAFAW